MQMRFKHSEYLVTGEGESWLVSDFYLHDSSETEVLSLDANL